MYFDINGILENLSFTGQQELANILLPKYSPWSATNVVSENCKLNQILQTLTQNLVWPPAIPIVAPHDGVPPLGVLPATPSGSGAPASNSRSTTHPIGHVTSRVRSRVTTEAIEPTPKKQRSSTNAGSSGSSLIHVDTQE